MAGIVNQVPQGLLSILDMKARGQNPRELASQVGGSIELLPLYLQNARQLRTLSITPTTPGFFGLDVPQDQLWYIHSWGVTSPAALAASTAYAISMAVRRANTVGTVSPVPVTPRYTFSTNERISLGQIGPFICKPGDGVGIYISQAALGTAAGMFVEIDVTPIPV